MKVKALAVLKATQTKDGRAIRNDRLIGQAISKETPSEFRDLKINKEIPTQIEFFFDRHVSRRVKMIRLIDSGCALVVPRRSAPLTYCGLPMQVLKA